MLLSLYLSVSTSARRILGMGNVISTTWTSDFNYMLKDQKVLTRKDNTNEMTCVKNYGGHILSLCILACFLRMILWTVIQARSYWWKLKFLYSIQEVVLLCPVRVLKIYISAAKHLRNGLKNLFVLYKKKKQIQHKRLLKIPLLNGLLYLKLWSRHIFRLMFGGS